MRTLSEENGYKSISQKKRRQSSPLTTTKPHNSLKKIMREILDVLTFDLTLIIVVRLIDFTIFNFYQ